MKASLDPRKLTRLGQARSWAAVAFGASSLELTTARVEGANVQVLQQASANAAPPAGTQDAAPQWQVAAQLLRRQFDPHEHRVVTSVSCEDVLCQTLRLPATEPAELKQMINLQVDDLTPLPLEEVVYSFEPLETVEGQTRVLVAIAPRAAVNERVAALETAGLPPEIVSVDALAMFRALSRRQALPADDRLNVLVILNPTAANVIVHSQSAPLVVRSIVLGAGGAASEQGESVLREELQRTLVAAEADQPQRAVGTVTFLAPTDELKLLAERVAGGLTAPSTFLTNGAVPSMALSLCLQCAAGESLLLNLLPDEWRQRRRSAAFRRRLIRGGIVVGVVYAVALVAFLTLLGIKKAHLRRVETEVRNSEGDFDAARQLQSELITMRKQLDTKFSALEVLREITVRMPEGMKLNEFSFKKDQTVTLRGQAPSAAIAIDFQSRLEQCDLFSKVTPGQSRTEGGGLTKFDLVCTLKTAAGVGTTPP
ncbi:MAG TPA: pilus assembly protein PilM [Verrucomicrobiae bacterium]|nr:pilus assembly protein PilM [Verrucomicrobiae bacterium]